MKLGGKKNTFFCSLYLIFFLFFLGFYKFFYELDKKDIAGLTEKLIYSWTESDSFLDDVYTYNIEGISYSFSRFLRAYDLVKSGEEICIRIQLKSFSEENYQVKEVCTNNASMSKLIDNTDDFSIKIGSIDLNIGSKKLGSIRYYIKNNVYSRFYGLYFFVFLAFYGVSVFSILFFLGNRFLKENNDLPSLDDFNAFRKRVDSIKKIVSSNKQHFALNHDVVFAVYKHPYSNLTYRNGTNLSIRCSLSDLDSSGIVDFFRVNKSVILNSYFFKCSGGFVFNSSDNVVSINIKGKREDISVSPVYRDELVLFIKNNGG